jgi:hypothetical protein
MLLHAVRGAPPGCDSSESGGVCLLHPLPRACVGIFWTTPAPKPPVANRRLTGRTHSACFSVLRSLLNAGTSYRKSALPFAINLAADLLFVPTFSGLRDVPLAVAIIFR